MQPPIISFIGRTFSLADYFYVDAVETFGVLGDFKFNFVTAQILHRFLESIHSFSSSPIGEEKIFAIPISSTCTEDLMPVNRSIVVAGRLLMTNLATLL